MKIYWACDRCLKHGECEMEAGKELSEDHVILDRAHKSISPKCNMPVEHIFIDIDALSPRFIENLKKLEELERLRRH